MRNLLTVDEISKVLHCHPTHIRRLCSKKRIPHIQGKLGIGLRFDQDKIEDWLEEGSYEPGDKK